MLLLFSVLLVDISGRLDSSSYERSFDEFRSYISLDQTVHRRYYKYRPPPSTSTSNVLTYSLRSLSCLACNRGFSYVHSLDLKKSWHKQVSRLFRQEHWDPELLHEEGIGSTCKALQTLDDLGSDTLGLPLDVISPTDTEAAQWRHKLMSSILSRSKERNDAPPDFDESHLRQMLEDQHNRCAKYGVLGIQADGSPWSLSLDRIDSNRGYFKDNVISFCWW